MADEERDEIERWDEIPGVSRLNRCHPRDVKCHLQIYIRLDFIYIFFYFLCVRTRVTLINDRRNLLMSRQIAKKILLIFFSNNDE